MIKRTLSWFKKKADKYFSLYIRRLDSDTNGMAVCVTCKAIKHWKELQCGHYITRNHLSTRFDPQNVGAQCVGCNMYGGGKHDLFALYSSYLFTQYV